MMPDNETCWGCEFYQLVPSGERTDEGVDIFILCCQLGECKFEGGREGDDRDDMF